MEGWLKTGFCSGSRPDPKLSRGDRNEIISSDSDGSEQGSSRNAEESSTKRFRSQAWHGSTVKLRKYDPKFILYGFVGRTKDENPDALCVVCQAVLRNSSMVPAKLQRHLNTKHPDLVGKPACYFERVAKNLEHSQSTLRAADSNKQRTEATLRVSYLIGRAGESHTIAERLLKPCFIETAKCLGNEKFAKELQVMPLSNDTVSRRIRQISAWLEKQLLTELRRSPCWALQVDESTDVAGLAILLVFVRFVHESAVKEELLLCSSLQGRTTGETIFDLVDSYLSASGLSWSNCVDVCSDGAAAMTGRHRGFVSRVKEVAHHVSSSHCILHREALAMKRIPDNLRSVLEGTIRIVNLIKARPLQSRIFKLLCEDMGSLHTSLLLHTEVRWLSRGRTLSRVFELREEIVMFSLENDNGAFESLRNPKWLQRLAYLADLFQKLNALNATLQGRQVDVFLAHGKIQAMKEKIESWTGRVYDGQVDFFPTLQDFLDETGEGLDEETRSDITAHLTKLRETFEHYFPSDAMKEQTAHQWVRNPFIVKNPSTLTASQNDKLADIRNDAGLKDKFDTLPLADFWAGLAEECDELSRIALRVLVPFVTTYLCETGFSTYTSTKTKYRNRLNAEDDLRIQLSDRAPNFPELSKQIQYQPSH